MLQKTADYMKQRNMAKPGDKIVIGLSGGVDSVCLFHILKDLGYLLEAVHVNHGIRGEEADRDEAFVKKLCAQYNIPFHGYRFDVPAISREAHLSEEEAGRNVRRQTFLEVMEKTGAKAIALAHHGNDRAETFLFHLSRGTGVKGLSSMRPMEGKFIRPLLWAERKEIEQYAQNMGYEFVEDGTNATVDYTRNKMRHQVIPLLQEINSKSVSHILGAAEKLSAVSEYIDREAEKLCLLSAVMYQNEVQILKFAFEQGDVVLRIPVLQKCVEYLTGSLVNITEEHLQKLLELFEMQTGKEVYLPGRLTAVRTYEGIRMFFREEKVIVEPVAITGQGTYLFGGLTFEVSIEEWNERKIFPIKNYTKCFDYDKILNDIFLRTRESGDFLEINKDHGRKSLQDYLVNEKIPKNERDKVILLADGSHILWVVGKRISENYKVTKETKKVLKVQVCGGNFNE
ncbi:MAG: tRNA lysidine(34) synthetase TilS [Lachnospiraceae bacterium]|nr:tRNA lysidine(34) synthetase TilS [Lachnospiraceae bacterium]